MHFKSQKQLLPFLHVPCLGSAVVFIINLYCCLALGITCFQHLCRMGLHLWSPWTLPRNRKWVQSVQICACRCTSAAHHPVFLRMNWLSSNFMGFIGPIFDCKREGSVVLSLQLTCLQLTYTGKPLVGICVRRQKGILTAILKI